MVWSYSCCCVKVLSTGEKMRGEMRQGVQRLRTSSFVRQNLHEARIEIERVIRCKDWLFDDITSLEGPTHNYEIVLCE